jgi:diketogulonate reductase-like aldo/keto reductase
LTANATELNRSGIHAIAGRFKCGVAQVVFRFALQAGMIPLTGTTDHGHMLADLATYEVEGLDAAEMRTIESIATA